MISSHRIFLSLYFILIQSFKEIVFGPMSLFRFYYNADIHRYGGEKVNFYVRVLLFLYRKAATKKGVIIKTLYKVLLRLHSRIHGNELHSCCKIGKGLYLGHVYNITISGDAVIGENCNIHKGVTIGRECRGPRQGCPTIGNRVSICVNATVVGRIVVGDDVIIAPNSFVNCDVPSHSIVIGNPCIIKHRDHATEGYVVNLA